MKLEKNIWTNDDFEKMGWHDSYLHAISFNKDYELSLDIDYIFEWIPPKESEDFFSFFISPSTLVFENVSELKLDIDINEPFELRITGISRNGLPLSDLNQDCDKRKARYQWIISANQGEITFAATGYTQFIRRKPIMTRIQQIEHSIRGGISFDRKATVL